MAQVIDPAALPPQQFIEKVLVQGLHVKWLIVGEDFRYGAKRAGDVAMLIEAGKRYGFQVEALPTVMNNGARISSSVVRSALAQGFPASYGLLPLMRGSAYELDKVAVRRRRFASSIEPIACHQG